MNDAMSNLVGRVEDECPVEAVGSLIESFSRVRFIGPVEVEGPQSHLGRVMSMPPVRPNVLNGEIIGKCPPICRDSTLLKGDIRGGRFHKDRIATVIE